MRFEATIGKLEPAFKNFQSLPEWPVGRDQEKGQQKVMNWPAKRADQSGNKQFTPRSEVESLS
jgi:hypothetical protein